MPRWWKVSLWKVVLFPALAGLIAVGYSLLQGAAHRWLGLDPHGNRLDGWESDKHLTSPFQELSNRLGLGKPVRLR